MANWRIFTQQDLLNSALAPDGHTTGDIACEQDGVAADRGAFVRCSPADLATAIGRLRFHIVDRPATQYRHGTLEKIPRSIHWRAYRLDHHGGLLAVTVFRNSEAFNLCEVDVFLAGEHPDLAALTTTRALLLFLLADAATTGGSMALQYTRDCFNGHVPPGVVALAEANGIELRYAARGAIAPNESRQLYLALSGLSPGARGIVHAVQQQNSGAIDAICTRVARGIWTCLGMDWLLQTCSYPEAIAMPLTAEHGLVFEQTLKQACHAIACEVLVRALRRRERPNLAQITVRAWEHDSRRVDAAVVPEDMACRITHVSEPTTLLGWGTDGEDVDVPNRLPITVFIRARSTAGLRAFLEAELAEIAERRPDGTVWLVVPRDYVHLSAEERERIEDRARPSDVSLLVCPMTMAALVDEAGKRL
jgi:hypothetical protein